MVTVGARDKSDEDLVQHMLKIALSGGGQIKYPSKPRQQQKNKRSQEPLVSLPSYHGNRREGKGNDSRYVTRSVPVRSARHKKDDGDCGSNSAPNEVNRRHTNHNRQPRPSVPRLPKLNNLLHEPLQQQVHGTSTATEAGRKESPKRWASSWADARANSSTTKETRAAADHSYQPAGDLNHRLDQAKDLDTTPSPAKSTPPRVPNGSPAKPPRETEGRVADKEIRVAKTDSQEPKPINGQGAKSQVQTAQEAGWRTKRRTKSTSEIETKLPQTLTKQSKSSAVLSNQDVTRQNSQILTAYSSPTASSLSSSPRVRVSTVSRGSQNASKPQAPKKKRLRKPVIITRKSVVKQKTLQSVYGNMTYKYQRQVRVLQKMEQIQRKEVEEYNQEVKQKEKQRMEGIVRQRTALKKVRDKFDEEQVRRFRRQYVSWKSVEEDRLNRSSEAYGLPDFIYEDRYERTLKTPQESSKKAPKTFQKYATWVRNIKVFEKLLNPKIGANLEHVFKSNTKTIVEGIDTVKLDNDDSSRAKKVNVKHLIGSARKLLTVTETTDDISDVSSYREDELSDDDSLDLSDEDQ